MIEQFLFERKKLIGYYEANKIGYEGLIEGLQKISEQYSLILKNVNVEKIQ